MHDTPESSRENSLTPSTLARAARLHIEKRFNEVWLTGELSNFRRPGSGHWYFSVKDDAAQIRCAMFVNRNRFAKLQPNDGAQVLLRGRVSLFEARGDFQIIVDHIEPAGEGALRLAYEALLKQLHIEGLTAAERKRPLPANPARIAVITSASGAALQDMLSVWRRRYPLVEVLVLDVAVQGSASEAQVLRALNTVAGGKLNADLAIVSRGGGSLEDLWTFNLESVARAIANSPIPIISAIGHEVDTAISDYVADLRAPTPTAAAELSTPDLAERLREFVAYEQRLTLLLRHRLQDLTTQLSHYRTRLVSPERRVEQWQQRTDELAERLKAALLRGLSRRSEQVSHARTVLQTQHPQRRLAQSRQDLTALSQRTQRAMTSHLTEARNRAAAIARTLDALSPLQTLNRGYAILTTADRDALTEASDLAAGQVVHAYLSDGMAELEVTQTHPGTALHDH